MSIVSVYPELTRQAYKYAQMAWATPEYSKKEVDHAGRTLAQSLVFLDEEAAAIIGNWRGAHSFPLNTLQIALRRMAHRHDDTALISQRLKRLSSIAAKLRLLKGLRLSEMQDIAGCRAVVGTVARVNAIVREFTGSQIKHRLVRENDYIGDPKASGYRSHHLVYRYFSDRSETYNGLKIEVQIRSSLQHAWATAVETVGTFISQALKSSQGSEDWLRFFALMGSEIANREHTPSVPGTTTNLRVLKREIRSYAKSLDVIGHLRAYRNALRQIENFGSKAHFFLLQLDPVENSLSIKGYQSTELNEALAEYLNAEETAISSHQRSDAVLVSVESAGSLRRAYPNYFLDTDLFIRAVEKAIS